MNAIQPVGQAITCTNYTTPRIFDFNPDPVCEAAESFACTRPNRYDAELRADHQPRLSTGRTLI